MKKQLFDSPWLLGTLLLIALSVLGLIRFGFSRFERDSLPPDPIQEGKKLYVEMRCGYCHRLAGQGGTIGPALDDVGFRRTPEWMARHFRDPQKVSPLSQMAPLSLEGDQIRELTAFMNSLGGYGYTPLAPILFKEHCASCHQFHGLAPHSRLDLSTEGKFRDRDFIQDYIQDPQKLNPKAGMRGFQKFLTPAQLADLANYIYRQSR